MNQQSDKKRGGSRAYKIEGARKWMDKQKKTAIE